MKCKSLPRLRTGFQPWSVSYPKKRPAGSNVLTPYRLALARLHRRAKRPHRLQGLCRRERHYFRPIQLIQYWYQRHRRCGQVPRGNLPTGGHPHRPIRRYRGTEQDDRTGASCCTVQLQYVWSGRQQGDGPLVVESALRSRGQ